jgi:hypothetical protein
MRSTDKVPCSLEELLQFIAEAARTHYEQTQRGLQGSALAYRVRERYPSLDYTAFDLTRLGDVVRLAVDRGLIRRNDTVKHLEVLPAEQSDRPLVVRAESKRPRVKYARPEVWRAVALANADSPTRTFLNRETGDITTANAGEVERWRADPSLVELEPLPPAEQPRWLKDFLRSRGVLSTEDEDYLRSLIRSGLRELGSSELSRDWRYLRSRRVVGQIKRWAQNNGVNEDFVLQDPPTRDTAPRGEMRTAKRSIHEAGETQTSADLQQRRRKAVLAAIEEMPWADLERLALPLHYILRHFDPK